MADYASSGGIGVTDGDKGDIAVSGGGTVWTVEAAPAAVFSGAIVRKSGNQSHPNNTWIRLTYELEDLDTDGFHSTSSNTERFTIPAGKAGKYLLDATVRFDAGAGVRQVFFAKNSGTTPADGLYDGVVDGDNSAGGLFSTQAIVVAAEGDEFQVHVWQNSGSTRNVTGSSFRIAFLGT